MALVYRMGFVSLRRMLQQLASVVSVLVIAFVSSAHIGSPDAWFNGMAGPYHVRVHVKAPPVVPGIAIVSVTPVEAVTSVAAFVNKFDAVDGGPPPDVAVPDEQETKTYRTQLWVMDPGSNSVTVLLKGSLGEGKVVVPLVAVAGRRLEFNGALSAVLGVAALILVAGLLSMIGAASRESALPPGSLPDSSNTRVARRSMIRGGLAIIVVIAGLGVWWRAEDSAFAAEMFRPLAVSAITTPSDGGGRSLELAIVDSAWTMRNTQRRMRARGGSELTDLVSDHGQLMHLFVIAENGESNFAHLHPRTIDSTRFRSPLPPLPEGRYRVFADITHSTGFAQTLSASVSIPAMRGEATAGRNDDDSWSIAREAATDVANVGNGATLSLINPSAPRVAGTDAQLRFVLGRAANDTVSIEPYMGMAGHAVVIRDDGGVFIHLHPMGTISAAAQMLLTGDHSVHSMNSTAISDSLEFPYAFPSAGMYVVWVQFKRYAKIETASFRVSVGEERRR